MRIVFMGTPDFAVPTLELISQRYSIVGVYSQPPKPSGRGYVIRKSPVHQWAETRRYHCFYPEELKSLSVQQELQTLNPDIIVVAAYGLILPKEVLNIPKYGCYNVHFSLLPRWRGAAPMQRALQVGDTVTGVTIMKMDIGLDTGPIISQQTMTIASNCIYNDLSNQLSSLGAESMINVLNDLIIKGDLVETVQPTKGITYAHKLKKEEGVLNWSYSAVVLHNAIRAFNPWPGTSFMYQNQRIKVLEATLSDNFQNDASPGTIIDECLGISCGGYNPFTASWDPLKVLRPLLLQKSGGKPLSTQEFLHGFPMPVGTSVS